MATSHYFPKHPGRLPTAPGSSLKRLPRETPVRATLGDLWMWLHLMWLQFEVARGPVGVD